MRRWSCWTVVSVSSIYESSNSSLTPRPWKLFSHFFSVAFFSIWILMTQGLPGPGGKRIPPSIFNIPALIVLSFKVFWTACFVFLPVMMSEFRT